MDLLHTYIFTTPYDSCCISKQTSTYNPTMQGEVRHVPHVCSSCPTVYTPQGSSISYSQSGIRNLAEIVMLT